MKGAVFRSNGQGQIHLGVCSNLLQSTELEQGQFPTDCQNTYGPYMFEMFMYLYLEWLEKPLII